MKINAIILLTTILLINNCDKNKAIFEIETCKIPFTIRYEDNKIGFTEIYLDFELLKGNNKFRALKNQKNFSKGRFHLKESIITLLVNQEPVQNYSGDFYLINFDLKYNPIDKIKIRGPDVADSTVITQDTIFKYISYRTTKWVEKYCIDNKGQFVLTEKKKTWQRKQVENEYDTH